ncbi:hypothetical protein HS088_TW11G00145 [Tripterygium wilfordii]|uniref:Uncharacterized protein n=1 Tax=Tripterygium wilfordii TaxID=458696 RepID=A0A7J7D170_TRIWF|nr:hypothetical protein HS088_TW11G00145 [Tripterygium wilfordii]
MSRDRVCSISIPFSWEIKPGVSKSSNNIHGDLVNIRHLPQLNLPPCPSKNVYVGHISATPSPIRGSQTTPTRGSNSFKRQQQQDPDPFLAAYMNCTASPDRAVRPRLSSSTTNSHEERSGMRSYMSNLLCKLSCDVMSDDVVSFSHVHIAVTSRGRHGGIN